MAKSRRPYEYRLKAWGDPAWQRKLSKTVTVSRVDEDIPTAKQRPDRKPWYIALTQKPDFLKEVGGVNGLPPGNTLLLSEYDVVELVRYLLEPQTALWGTNPTPTEPGEQEVRLFVEPGMVAVLADSGEVVNGEAHWSPAYFKKQEAYDVKKGLPTRKIHTLPWKLK